MDIQDELIKQYLQELKEKEEAKADWEMIDKAVLNTDDYDKSGDEENLLMLRRNIRSRKGKGDSMNISS